MNRPPIEEFLEVCNKKSPGEWHDFPSTREMVSGKNIMRDIGNKSSSNLARDLMPQDARFIAFSANFAESIAQYALYLEQKYTPHPFDPEDRKTWPEMEVKALVNFKNTGWRIAKLCYTVLAPSPTWKTDGGFYVLNSAIEWQNLPGEVQ